MRPFTTNRLYVSGVALLVLSTLIKPARAQHINSSQAPCQKTVSTAKVISCFAEAAGKTDDDLNTVYMKFAAALTNRGNDLPNLQKAQRLWIQFRDASCYAENAMYEGGSAASQVKFACIEELTRQRTSDLKVTYGWVVEKFGNGKF